MTMKRLIPTIAALAALISTSALAGAPVPDKTCKTWQYADGRAGCRGTDTCAKALTPKGWNQLYMCVSADPGKPATGGKTDLPKPCGVGSPGQRPCPTPGDKAPPKPEYPADPCVPGCDATGMWCTQCDDDTGRGCVEISGPGVGAVLCDGDLSWCYEDGECGEVEGHPWCRDDEGHADIDVCILTLTDYTCCGCISGWDGYEHCSGGGEEEAPPVEPPELFGAAEPCDPFEAGLEVFGIDDFNYTPDLLICDLWERGYSCELSEDGNTENCCTPYGIYHDKQTIPSRTCCSHTNGQNVVTCGEHRKLRQRH